MPTPETFDAAAAFMELLSNTGVVTLLFILATLALVSPVALAVILARLILKIIETNREDEEQRHGTTSAALELAGTSAHNVELLRQSVEKGAHAQVKQIELFTSEVHKQNMDTRGAILENLGDLNANLGNLAAAVAKQGTAQTQRMETLNQDLKDGFAATRAEFGPILKELATLSQNTAEVISQVSQLIEEREGQQGPQAA